MVSELEAAILYSDLTSTKGLSALELKSSTPEAGEQTRIQTNMSEIYGECSTSTRRNDTEEKRNLRYIFHHSSSLKALNLTHDTC